MDYYIKKTSNGEFKEIERHLKLNISKYIVEPTTLYFDVENEEIPSLIDYDLFWGILAEQIQKGLIESLNYSNGVIKASIRDGNTIKNYTIDFNFAGFDRSIHNTHYDYLLRSLYKTIALYNASPNSYISSEQKYMWLIYDIIDGDRNPIIEDQNELIRLFEVYNSHKEEILETLLENVVFYEDDNSIIDFTPRLREKYIKMIKYDVLSQMDAAIVIFASNNDAIDIYLNYLENTYLPRREIEYVEDEENEIEMPKEVERGTILSLSKDILKRTLNKIKELTENNLKRTLKKEGN